MMVEGFGIHDFGLADGFFVGGVSEGLVFVKDGDFSFGIFADGDLGVAQGVVRAVGLDLVDDLVELEGQVLGERPVF